MMARDERADNPAPTRILIVEDVANDAELMTRELRRALGTCAIVRVEAEAALVQELHRFAPDAVLTDHSLPTFSGIDVLRVVPRERPLTPVIVVTGALDEETAADYIKAGAADYVVKQRLHRLGPAVRRALVVRHALQAAADAEAALARNERRFRKLVEFSSDVVTLLDRHGRIVYSTHSLHPNLGYAPGEKLGHSVVDLIHQEDRPTIASLSREVLGQPNQVAKADVRVAHKDGSWRELEVVAVNRLEEEAVGAIVVTYHDVTERRRAQQALEESEARFRKLIQASFGGITVTVDGVIREANRGYAEMFGYTVEEVIGRPVADFVADESLDEVRRRIAEGTEGRFEAVGRHKDGRKVLLEVTEKSHTIRGRRGRITALRDVTEQRRLEQQSRQAQRMEAVGRLAGGVAHDFNNLLTAILGSTDLLLETLASDHPGREDALETRKAALRAADLTHQLLAFSRTQVLAPRVVGLNDVVANLERMLKRLIGEDVELYTVLADDLGAVRADPAQLEQVIVNLAVNARDAMPTGGKLTMKTANVTLDETYATEHAVVVAPGAYVMLAVSDTGTGMDADTKTRAFEPFFTTKPKGKGTGLGLATVYGIVKQSGGFIWLYSEPGQGTAFKIYLPRVDAPVESAEWAPPKAGSLRGSETVLVVEDQEDVRNITRRTLEARGYQVLVAASGDEALRVGKEREALRRVQSDGKAIDLLVTDVVMPGMSGRDVALQLAPAHPSMKVLYVSGYPDESIAHHGVLEPGVAFLEKPFTAERLAQKVREVLDSSGPRALG